MTMQKCQYYGECRKPCTLCVKKCSDYVKADYTKDVEPTPLHLVMWGVK